MAITFQSVIDNVRKDIPVCDATDPDIVRYCHRAWHEMFHTYPSLRRAFNTTTGAVTEIAEDAPEDATEFPDVLDGRRIPIEASVRASIVFKSKMDDAQAKRYKIEIETFTNEQGIDNRV